MNTTFLHDTFPTYPESEEEYLLTIINNLEITYKSTNNDIRKRTEKFLKEKEQTILLHLPYILKIIKLNTLSKETACSLLIFIRNSIDNLKSNQSFSKNFVIALIKEFISCLLSNDFPNHTQKPINQCFESLITNNKIIEIDRSIIDELVSLFQMQLTNNNISISSYKGLSYILSNILSSPSCISKDNVDIIMMRLLNCCEVMLGNIITVLISMSNDQNETTVILTYVNSIKVIFELLTIISIQAQNMFNNITHFSFMLKKDFQMKAEKLLHLNFEEKNEIVIKTKTKIMKFINSLLPLLSLYSTQKEISIIHMDIITYILNYFNSDNFFIRNVYDNKSYENLINQKIIYLSQIAFISPYRGEFLKLLLPFTKNIMFPLLISTSNEIQNLEDDEDGTNYSNYIYDLTLDKKTKHLKSSISKFISIGCKYENEFLKFIIEYCVALIQFSFGINNNNTISPLINQNDYMSSHIVSNNINRVETSLLVLCIVSTNVFNLQNEQKMLLMTTIYQFFEQFYISGNEKLIHVNLIKQRLCMFISIYFEEFIKMSLLSENTLIKICEFLLQNIFHTEKKIAQYESFESLKIIFLSIKSNQFKQSFHHIIIQKYLSGFISFIKHTNNVLFFDLLYELDEIFTKENTINVNINDDLIKITKMLFVRILTEISPRRMSHSIQSDMMVDKNLNSNYKIIIKKCFLIINKLFSNTQFILSNLADIEELLVPLLSYMKYPNKIEFDEDLIQIMIMLLRILNELPLCSIKLLIDLCQYLRKKKGITLDLFELLNLYIIKAKPETFSNVDNNSSLKTYEDFCKIIFKNFKKSFAKESNSKISAYLGTLLIQILVSNSKDVPITIIKDIISFSTERLDQLLFGEKSNHSDTTLPKNLQLLSQGLITLLFTMFINYSTIMLEQIEFNTLMNYFEFQSAFPFVSENQCKLLAYSVLMITQAEWFCRNCSNNLDKLINTIRKIVEKSKKHEKEICGNNCDINVKLNEDGDSCFNVFKCEDDDDLYQEIENKMMFCCKDIDIDYILQKYK